MSLVCYSVTLSRFFGLVVVFGLVAVCLGFRFVILDAIWVAWVFLFYVGLV